jgi:hypothetical protein
MPFKPKRGAARIPVSTILTPLERSKVDAAAHDLCDPLHRESLDEVLTDLRQQKVGLVLISVTRYGSQSSARVAAMVREFPRIPTVALLTETQNSTPHSTLALGQLGIRTLVDARMPTGADAQEPTRVPELDRLTAICTYPDQSGFTGSVKGLLAFL